VPQPGVVLQDPVFTRLEVVALAEFGAEVRDRGRVEDAPEEGIALLGPGFRG
jgi:hypothetical protein